MTTTLDRHDFDTKAVLRLREDLALALRAAAHHGLAEGVCNHFSVELPGGTGRFLLNPRGLLWREVQGGDIVMIDDGVSAVVVAGSTGEADTLDDDERRRLLDAVRARVDGVPVLAGTGGTWAGQAARRTAAARDGGADAALVLSPRRTADVRPYYAEVAAAAGDLPLLAYHYPVVSPPGIPSPSPPAPRSWQG